MLLARPCGSSPYETRYLITARGLHDDVVGRELEFPKYMTHLMRARHPAIPRLVPLPPVRSFVDLTLNSPLPTVRHRSALRAPRLTLEAKYNSRPVLARRTCSIASSAPALISIWTLIPAPFVNKSTFRRTANCHRASFVHRSSSRLPVPVFSGSPASGRTSLLERRDRLGQPSVERPGHTRGSGPDTFSTRMRKTLTGAAVA
jgi:hypothetical protein